MTGHIVLSTLHTVGAVESVSRLADMGVESYLLGDTLKGVVAQRLLRKICEGCIAPVKYTPESLGDLGLDPKKATFYEGTGCDNCRGTGFKGRVGIYEILVVDAYMRSLIQRGATTDELTEAAISRGLDTLRNDGLRKAQAGEVALKDVLSATT